MKLSTDQKLALQAILKWLRTPNRQPNYLTFGGYAGTGKTTITALLRSLLHQKNPKLKVALVSFTGRAAQVLKVTLKKKQALYPQDFTGTIHSLIYAPVIGQGGKIISWSKKDKLDYQLIVVDEASMVNAELWHDLVSFDLPILAIGDHGQLPPINDSFNLMKQPQIKLEKIHRQAADNPIIKLSIQARKAGKIPVGKFASGVEKLNAYESETQERVEELMRSAGDETLILCGYNHTRIKINNFMRQARFFEPGPEPQINDRLICLKNNHQKNIYNGMIGTLKHINIVDDNFYYCEIEFAENDTLYQGNVYRHQFGNQQTTGHTPAEKELIKQADLFDFGYGLTVHKAQGSQAKRVILFEERFKQMDDQQWRRWLYTGITRAEKELYLIGAPQTD